MANFQPEVGEIVTAKGARSGRWCTGAFARHCVGATLNGQSVLVQASGDLIYVITATIQPVKES